MIKLKEENRPGNTDAVKYAQCEEFACMSIINLDKSLGNSYIVDTGAFNHICSNNALFVNMVNLSKNANITLPNGTSKLVTKFGRVQINPKLLIDDCLFVPYFRFNLLSVNRCIRSSQLDFTFTDSSCVFHDQQYRGIVCMAMQIRDYLFWMMNLSSLVQ
ncbi:hypothetical protein LIER_28855 [Lithospermum erythrorhizon]|uniref:Retrovirus-related Pol polyprotein from transposon TNT 1-94-like beta-barrel domain-containing protein n=1 Tax=Lithospermum erythrorhizon TaxID=34254 RepID=A0AAV3RKF6_LITER